MVSFKNISHQEDDYEKINKQTTYISSAIVADDRIDEWHEQIFHIFAPSIGKIGRKRVQNDQIFVCGVEKGLR